MPLIDKVDGELCIAVMLTQRQLQFLKKALEYLDNKESDQCEKVSGITKSSLVRLLNARRNDICYLWEPSID